MGTSSFDPFGEHLPPKLLTQSLRATGYGWPVPRCSRLGAVLHHFGYTATKDPQSDSTLLTSEPGSVEWTRTTMPGPPCQERSQWHRGAATAEPPTPHVPLPGLDHVTVHFCHKMMAGIYFLKQTFNWPNSWRLFSCTDRPRHQPLMRRIWVQLIAVLPKTPFDSTHPIFTAHVKGLAGTRHPDNLVHHLSPWR